MNEPHYYYIDWLKVIAFLEVVLLHSVAGGLYALDEGGGYR